MKMNTSALVTNEFERATDLLKKNEYLKHGKSFLTSTSVISLTNNIISSHFDRMCTCQLDFVTKEWNSGIIRVVKHN